MLFSLFPSLEAHAGSVTLVQCRSSLLGSNAPRATAMEGTMEGTEQVRVSAVITVTWRKVLSLVGVSRGEKNSSMGWGELGTPQHHSLLRQAFPVLSNYNMEKEIHLTCKQRWATNESFYPQNQPWGFTTLPQPDTVKFSQ